MGFLFTYLRLLIVRKGIEGERWRAALILCLSLPLAFLIPPLSAPSLSLNAHGFKKEWSTQTVVTPPSPSPFESEIKVTLADLYRFFSLTIRVHPLTCLCISTLSP